MCLALFVIFSEHRADGRHAHSLLGLGLWIRNRSRLLLLLRLSELKGPAAGKSVAAATTAREPFFAPSDRSTCHFFLSRLKERTAHVAPSIGLPGVLTWHMLPSCKATRWPTIMRGGGLLDDIATDAASRAQSACRSLPKMTGRTWAARCLVSHSALLLYGCTRVAAVI